MDLKGLKATVVGIARSGIGAAILLKGKGAQVYVTDSGMSESIMKSADTLKAEGIEVEIGRHSESFVKDKDLIVISPGVTKDSPVIGWANLYRIPVISELELGYLFCRGKIIAITGTNGKTTTTSLIGKMIKDSGKPVIVCGNIGTSFCGEVANITREHYVVLEVSSFQLEYINKFKPYISVILNLTDNHLDRHKDFSEYKTMKSKIFLNQDEGDFIILNYGDPILRNMDIQAPSRKFFYSNENEVEGAFIKDKDILISMGGKLENVCPTAATQLKGLHNLDNTMAAILVGKLIGLSNNDIVKSISSFVPLPHRFQFVDEIGDVEFINDSKATTVDATLKALESLDRPAILIAGGRDKESDFSVARNTIQQKVRHLVLIGEAREKIANYMKDIVDIREANSLEEAVELAYSIANKGEAILLSPMCTSFDMFRDYVERGEMFIKAVKNLKDKKCARYGSQY
ncbi:MAG: UDP-N-acetylmuramoyl-L-alanine--D-glutamate ligase [Candidatus Omnitrophica bacterium CG07_land_8_20_14_0_80_42_15]|uniref:UDP-N-acetylmuramoylalanine--D-glutamate ligase n=1 Tax=Candidatus Aquitaenariimonas noxiae TaxID=1974741 RepID=A0A2J0L510_9BACT|nr:MAG: UDP-N-acetylmuramoyl-L-alanine--D-glutamate ligase [Candidatus Omnitrophica bacterium CG07_land_8_20_14_0_80_42_15]